MPSLLTCTKPVTQGEIAWNASKIHKQKRGANSPSMCLAESLHYCAAMRLEDDTPTNINPAQTFFVCFSCFSFCFEASLLAFCFCSFSLSFFPPLSPMIRSLM